MLTLLAVGDVSPNRDDPPSIFRYCGDVFRKADLVFGQMEVPLSDRGTPTLVWSSWPARLAAKNISALTDEGAGFDVMSFASNHAMDYGFEAFYDTLEILKKNNIPTVGAGSNIAEARKAAILEKKGTRVGFLAYLSITSKGLVAKGDYPGCAPLRSSHAYQQVSSTPGTLPLVITRLFPGDKKAMEEDIRKLRPLVDVLVVSIHSGVHLMPAIIAMYQKEAAYSAIDAGADLVLQHHAHILKGIEVYRGKVIFYGLNHFAIEHQLPFPGRLMDRDDDERADYRRLVCGIKTEFHPDANKTLIAKAYMQDKRIRKVTYIPAHINPNREPEVLTRKDPKAQAVFDYMKQISESQDLKVNLSWDGDEVLVSSP